MLEFNRLIDRIERPIDYSKVSHIQYLDLTIGHGQSAKGDSSSPVLTRFANVVAPPVSLRLWLSRFDIERRNQIASMAEEGRWDVELQIVHGSGAIKNPNPISTFERQFSTFERDRDFVNLPTSERDEHNAKFSTFEVPMSTFERQQQYLLDLDHSEVLIGNVRVGSTLKMTRKKKVDTGKEKCMDNPPDNSTMSETNYIHSSPVLGDFNAVIDMSEVLGGKEDDQYMSEFQGCITVCDLATMPMKGNALYLGIIQQRGEGSIWKRLDTVLANPTCNLNERSLNGSNKVAKRVYGRSLASLATLKLEGSSAVAIATPTSPYLVAPDFRRRAFTKSVVEDFEASRRSDGRR
ncbi:hypothetical protein BUALT_Bualt09G0011700 [Buddleja alternifolia]|uniref:Uncharacterized protein n=1 Tax=Buddleja alternifolia TaxID=168488 RepID=A0AAV6X9X6_9LAMI|nr:hypothetical protein BUALT_Bualt09G0011700 [Buddleja alternifolia]